MADKQSTDAGLRELALFAGAGGGILGGHLLGWTTVCAVERDAYAAAVLAQRQNDRLLAPFPIWSNVSTFDGRAWRGLIDVVSGGFPCQDISTAGKGAGINGARSGLWGEMARIIGEVRPQFVWVENSPMLVGRGLTRVIGDLTQMGYDAQWCIVSASDIGAPHKRDRIWIRAVDSMGTPTCKSMQSSEQPNQLAYAPRWRRRTQWFTATSTLESHLYGKLVARRGSFCNTERIQKHTQRRTDQQGRLTVGRIAKTTQQNNGATHTNDSIRPNRPLADTNRQRLNTGHGSTRRSARQAISHRSTLSRNHVAYAHSMRQQQPQGLECNQRRRIGNGSQNMAYANGLRRQRIVTRNIDAQGRAQSSQRSIGSQGFIDRQWPIEPNVGRVAHGLAFRVDRLKAIGNGQVSRVDATAWRILQGS